MGFPALQPKCQLFDYLAVFFGSVLPFVVCSVVANGKFGPDMVQTKFKRPGNGTTYWISAGMRFKCTTESWV